LSEKKRRNKIPNNKKKLGMETMKPKLGLDLLKYQKRQVPGHSGH
jgi:hypothetical protein